MHGADCRESESSDEISMMNEGGGGGGDEYRILYKDREGDWMLLGDVPWE